MDGLFDDQDRGCRMVAMIYGDALFGVAMYPVCKAFNVAQLAAGKLDPIDYPSGIVFGLVKTAIRRDAEPEKSA